MSRVLVLGAGVIGAAIADSLAAAGASVIVLDMRGPGLGASQASAGILAPYVEAQHKSALLQLGVRSLALWDDFAGRLLETTGRSIGYMRSGTLQIALSDAEAEALRGELEDLRARDVAARWLGPEDLQSFEPVVTPSARGGLLIHTHGSVGVRALVAAQLESAKRAGVAVESGIEATRLESLPDGVRVHTNRRTIDTDVVVIATGSWSGRLTIDGVKPLAMRPVKGQLLQLRSPDLVPGRVIWGPHGYAVPALDGSLLFGATAEDAEFDENATADAVTSLTTAARELLPAAASAMLESVRVGLRPALPDNLPAIGPFAAAPRIIAATGHFRNGILLAPLTAEMVARFITDGIRDEALNIVRPDRQGIADVRQN